jgi:hypothetical protein
MPFEYFPRCRPVLAPETHFPFIATRDDWPFKREEVGGWTLTPFGGRGRWKDEIIEVEGLVRTLPLLSVKYADMVCVAWRTGTDGVLGGDEGQVRPAAVVHERGGA